MSGQGSREIEQVEEWALRLRRMAEAAFFQDTPEGNAQVLTGALCVAAGRILQGMCPVEDQPQGAEILVEFLRRGILHTPENSGPEETGPKLILPH